MSPEVTEGHRVMITYLLLGLSPEALVSSIYHFPPPFNRFLTTEGGQEKSRIAMTQQLGTQCPQAERAGSSALTSWA